MSRCRWILCVALLSLVSACPQPTKRDPARLGEADKGSADRGEARGRADAPKRGPEERERGRQRDEVDKGAEALAKSRAVACALSRLVELQAVKRNKMAKTSACQGVWASSKSLVLDEELGTKCSCLSTSALSRCCWFQDMCRAGGRATRKRQLFWLHTIITTMDPSYSAQTCKRVSVQDAFLFLNTKDRHIERQSACV
ncbi:hypothetical protein J3F83DRAFT_285456 [Trichoderma novae-zelandiae]